MNCKTIGTMKFRIIKNEIKISLYERATLFLCDAIAWYNRSDSFILIQIGL